MEQDEIIRGTCPKCGHTWEYTIRSLFKGDRYEKNCPKCHCNIMRKYVDKEIEL